MHVGLADRMNRRRWGRALLASFANADRDKIGVVAGGLAFYGLLGLLPAFVALIALMGLIANPSQVDQSLRLLTQSVPGGEGKTIAGQLAPLVQHGRFVLGLTLAFGTIGAIWSVSTAVNNAFVAMEVVYQIEKGRGFVRNRLISVVFTVVALGTGLLLLLGLIVLPSISAARKLSGLLGVLFGIGRWPFLAAIVYVGLLLVYRFGIRRKGVRWRDLLWGAAFGTVIWLIGSVIFTVWVDYGANYQAFYGQLSVLVVLLLWLLLSGYAVMMGAELNEVLDQEARGRGIPERKRQRRSRPASEQQAAPSPRH